MNTESGDAVRPLNILCSSTRQWNPGDEWIALGIRRLFRTLYAERVVNWILYDRSPDCFLEPWGKSRRRPDLLGNSYQPGEELPAVDLVVMAGTPEWLGPHVEPLARIRHTSAAPVFYLGIDYPSTELPCSPDDLRMLSGALIVTRGGTARRALQALGIQAHMLPCPALFAAPLEYPARALKSIGIVLQSDRVQNQAVSAGLKARMLGMLPLLQPRFSVKIVCNYIDEYLEFRSSLDCPVCYSYDSGEYFRLLSDCDLVISTRLHSALIANSLLKPAVLTNTEPRVCSAAELCPYIFVREPEDVPGFLEHFEPDPAARNLFNWKRNQEAQYLEILRGALQEHGLY
ncbi:MAG: polysaccharide pyruvyl transferase family protein [Bryobacteraceae bacterium]